MTYPFDDPKWRTLGDYLRWKLGIPHCETVGEHYCQLTVDGLGEPQLIPGRLVAGDTLIYEDIRVYRKSLASYDVKRGHLTWKCTSPGSPYRAAMKVIETLNDPPANAKWML